MMLLVLRVSECRSRC